MDGKKFDKCLVNNEKIYDKGGSTLHCAVARKFTNLIRSLLECSSGKEINMQDTLGSTPLHLACSSSLSEDFFLLDCEPSDLHCRKLNELAEIILLLLSYGADPHILNKAGKSPFHLLINSLTNKWISKNDDLENIGKLIINHFLHYGASINIKDKNGRTPLHYVVASPKVKIKKKFGIYRYQQYERLSFSVDEDDEEPAMEPMFRAPENREHRLDPIYNARENREQGQIMEPLHNAPVNLEHQQIEPVHNEPENHGRRQIIEPVHNALADHELRQIVEPLHNAFVDLERRHHSWMSRHFGSKPACVVETKPPLDFEWKVEKCPYETKPPFDQVWRKHFLVHLLNNGADINAVDNEGHTPLHLAVFENKIHIVEELLVRNANVDVKDNKGKTPLHYGVSSAEKLRHCGMLLLKKGASASIKNNEGHSPVDIAETKPFFGTFIKFLLLFISAKMHPEMEIIATYFFFQRKADYERLQNECQNLNRYFDNSGCSQLSTILKTYGMPLYTKNKILTDKIDDPELKIISSNLWMIIKSKFCQDKKRMEMIEYCALIIDQPNNPSTASQMISSHWEVLPHEIKLKILSCLDDNDLEDLSKCWNLNKFQEQ